MRTERTVLIVSVALACLLAPLVAETQQAGKVYRIGVLSPGSDSGGNAFRTAFVEALGAAGYQEGRNLSLEYLFANGEPRDSRSSRLNWSSFGSTSSSPASAPRRRLGPRRRASRSCSSPPIRSRKVSFRASPAPAATRQACQSWPGRWRGSTRSC
jgi:hypothetical protein